MSNHLEQFINDNRESFDGDEPDKRIWDRIQQQLDPAKKKQTTVVGMGWKKWSAAAAVVVLIGGSMLVVLSKKSQPLPAVAQKTQTAPDNNLPKVQAEPATPPSNALAQTEVKPKETVKKAEVAPDDQLADMNEEMYHFAKLVEIKHKELNKIKQDEPLLYQQFAGDVNKLDSVYHTLEKQLPENPNREQLIEAMIQNLQLQMDLLNHQLSIIKQINHSKKSAYEKAFKST